MRACVHSHMLAMFYLFLLSYNIRHHVPSWALASIWLHTFLPDTNNLQGETGCDGHLRQLSAHSDFATGAFTGCVLTSFGVQVDTHGKCC